MAAEVLRERAATSISTQLMEGIGGTSVCMNKVIHVVHAKNKSVLFTIAIISLVDAIHHPILQLKSAVQYLSSPLVLSRVLMHASREYLPSRKVRNWVMPAD